MSATSAPTPRTESLLAVIERRVAFIADRSRRVAIAFFDGGPLIHAMNGPSSRQDEVSFQAPTGRQIEKFAPQWASLVPNDPESRAQLGRLIARRCGLTFADAHQVRIALRLDEPDVRAAYARLFGSAPEDDFTGIEHDSDSRNDTTGHDAEGDMESDLEWVSLEAGEVLFTQAELSDAAYIVVSGRLSVFVIRPGAPPLFVNEVGPGELLGEMGVITGEPRSATIEAARDSELVRLPKQSFDRLVSQHPRAMMRVVRELILRVRNRSEGPTARVSLSLAVVAESPGVPLAEFCRRLADKLNQIGPTIHLSSRMVDEHLGPGVSQTPHRDVEFARLAAWLGQREGAASYAIYEADSDASAWSRCCLHQADRILAVVVPNDAPDRPPMASTFESGQTTWKAPRQELVVLDPDGAISSKGTGAWLDHTGSATQHHVQLSSRADMGRLARLVSGKGLGLALGAGGARGMAHVGVLRAFREAGIPIDLVGGTSVGAFVAAQVAIGMDHREIHAANRKIVEIGRKLLDFTFPLVSFVSARRFDRVMLDTFGERQIEDLPIKFFSISCNVTLAEKVVHERGLLRRFVRASCALPGVMPPVSENGELLVDGGVIDGIPIEVTRRLLSGGTVAAVDVGRDIFLGGDASIAEAYSGTDLVWERVKRMGRPKLEYPNVLALITRTAEVGGITRRAQSRPLADIYVVPRLGHVGTLDLNVDHFEDAVEIGYRAASESIAAWRGA